MRLRPLSPAAIALLVISLGAWSGWAFLVSARPALLEIDCLPAAQVELDGVPGGSTPWRRAVPSGVRRIRLAAPGFRERLIEIEARPGHAWHVDVALLIEDPEDPAAVRAVFRGLDLSEARLGLATYRCGPPSPIHGVSLVLPRGKVRPQDLNPYVVELELGTFVGIPPLEMAFWRGGTAVHRAMFDPQSAPGGTYRDRIPPRVAAEARARGGTFAWRIEDDADPMARTRFTVVTDETGIDSRLAWIDDRLAGQPQLLRDQARAQALLDAGLATAVIRFAVPLLERSPNAGQLVATLHGALRSLGLDETDYGRTAKDLARQFQGSILDRASERLDP